MSFVAMFVGEKEIRSDGSGKCCQLRKHVLKGAGNPNPLALFLSLLRSRISTHISW